MGYLAIAFNISMVMRAITCCFSSSHFLFFINVYNTFIHKTFILNPYYKKLVIAIAIIYTFAFHN
ncbi:MAG: hypothetical protein AMXMBFR79_15060 [Chitinophagaceae bacterium]